MPIDFEKDPKRIEQESFRMIRELARLDGLDRVQQQVAMRVVHSLGQPEIVSSLRFSDNACSAGLAGLERGCPILCDVEMVRAGLTRHLLDTSPLCFLNEPAVASLAIERGESRTMVALDWWREHLSGSVVMIGNAPTALFRLLEMLQDGEMKPALIVAMPVGFVGAAESKQELWDRHRDLGVECITLLGRAGGSSVTASSVNALLRINHNEWH